MHLGEFCRNYDSCILGSAELRWKELWYATIRLFVCVLYQLALSLEPWWKKFLTNIVAACNNYRSNVIVVIAAILS